MITLKLTHGLSHSNGIVSATARNPYVTVPDEEAARICIEGGYFERVDGAEAERRAQPAAAVPAAAAEPAKDNGRTAGKEAEKPAPVEDDEDELEAMTVPELKAYAETVGIDLGKLTRKVDIVAAIRKAEAEAEAE